jgi:Glycosyltransferase family 87
MKSRASASPYYLQPLALGVSLFLIAVQVSTWIFSLPEFLSGRADFRHLYVAGLMLRTGHARELYEKSAQQFFQVAYVGPGDFPMQYNHMAYEALLYAPFSIFSYRVAYFVFAAFNIALLCIVYRLLLSRTRNIAKIYRWLPAALIVAFLPIGVAVMQGQDSIVLLLTLVAAFVAIERGKEFLAGVLVALGLFKFTIVLPIALLFLVWRRWRFTAGFAVTSVSLASLSLALVGVDQALKYVHLLTSMGVKLSSDFDQAIYAIRITAMPNLRGLIFGLIGGRASGPAVQGLTLALSIAAISWVAITARKLDVGDRFLVAIVAAAVVSYHFLLHDMSVLFLPILAALDRYLECEVPSPAGKSAALLFIAPAWWCFAPYYFYLACLPLCVFLFFITAARNSK